MSATDQPEEVTTSEKPLLSEPRFRTLWLSQGMAQTAQNALLYSLLIVVLKATGSSTHTSLLVLSFILPSISLGMVVGVLLDRWRKIPVLILTNVLRVGACLLYLFFHSQVWAIYGISLAFSASGLFFNPSIISLIPAIVPRQRLVDANSLYNFTLTGSQLLGMVFLAPIVLKSFGRHGEEAMFIFGAGMFLLAGLLSWYLFSLKVEEPASRQRMVLAQIPSELRDGLLSLRNDPHSLLAVSQLIVSSSLVLLFAILIPRYMNDILRISPDNAAFVFAPTGVGALIGLRFLPWFIRRYGKSQAVVVGLCGIAISLIGFVLVKPLAEAMELTPGPLNPERFLGLSLLQALTMAFAGPLGFSYSFLNAPAQTVLHERAREDMRGRVFATQVAFANFISLLPVLFIGALTDLLDSFSNLQGITAVLLLIALGVLIMATVSWLLDRRMKQAEVATARAAPPV